MRHRNKKSNRNNSPKVEKKATSDPSLIPEKKMLVWKVSKIDIDGKWGWNKITCPYFLRNIWEKMREFEKKKWSEILGKDHYQNHMIEVSKIEKDAQDRLRELGYDDQVKLVSLRLTNRQRLWAIKSGGEAFLIWWDPNHEICPSHLKHT